MFEDVCFTCSRPVDNGSVPLCFPPPTLTHVLPPLRSRAYCSDECAIQDCPSAHTAAAIPPYFAASPVYAPKNFVIPSTDVRVPPFVLHNPHPDYPLPLALASPLHAPGNSVPTRLTNTLHARKRSSLSGSSASSALSTPSAPPLTDDDDSMSDPEFALDPRVDPSSSNPMLIYARRPSTTNTRSTVAPALSSSSSASTSASGAPRAHITGVRTASRSRHAHHLSVPAVALLDGFDKSIYVEGLDRQRHAEHIRPHSFKHHRRLEYDTDELSRKEELDASYATLTKLSMTTNGAEVISNAKSRRTPLRARPRASLPAYLSLMKLASPSADGFAGSVLQPTSPTTVLISPRTSHNAHKTSPTVAHSHTSSSTATLSASFLPKSICKTTATATIAQSLRAGRSPKKSPASETSPHLSDRANAPNGRSGGTSVRSMMVPIASSNPTTVTLAQQEFYQPEIRPLHVVDALCDCDGACSGTPRGRTRSRSNRPRSRSRSRTRERERRAHFEGESSCAERDDTMRARGSHLAAVMSRGRPHVRGMGGRGRRGCRTGTEDADEKENAQPRMGEIEIDWMDLYEAEDSGAEAERVRGRRRMPLRA
ncbi:hypothetical protein M0805_005974 [Coniferiporia weirii]|nr:hypothetical protein M0805_005974 [Coniferiporia weirii]